MFYTEFSPKQKELMKFIVKKIDTSGCSVEEVLEVLSESLSSLLGYAAPSKEEITECLDSKIIPHIRSSFSIWFDEYRKH